MPSSSSATSRPSLSRQQDFIAGHAQAGGAELLVVGTVGEIDVQRLGRAQPFDDFEAGQRLPAVEDLGRQHLGGRQRHAQRREIGRGRAFGLGQRGIERRQSEEHGRAIAFDRLEDRRRLWLARQQQRGGADREREGDGIAKAVGEEDFRHREADVVGRELEHVARERGFAIGHVVLQMDDALGPSGRAGRIHPERHLVAMGVGFREIGGEIPAAIVRRRWLRRRVIARAAVDDDQRAQAAYPCRRSRRSACKTRHRRRRPRRRNPKDRIAAGPAASAC